MMALRSWLFIPGDSEKKLAKADASGADAVIIDLEDAVAPDAKDEARAITADFLAARPKDKRDGPQLWVRVNPLDTGMTDRDLASIRVHEPDGYVLPKSEGPRDVAALEAKLVGDAKIMAVATETPRAVLKLSDFADGAPGALAALTWGAEDLSTALMAGGKGDADGDLAFTYRMVRSMCLIAAHAAGVAAIDGIYGDFRDTDGLEKASRHAFFEGFSGRLAIHPAQVDPINRAFTPSDEQRGEALRIVDAFRAAGNPGTVGLDGRMLDRPHLLQAQRILAF